MSVRPWPHSDIHIWIPSFLTLRTLGDYVLGPSGTLLKEQGSFNLVQNMGHKGPVLRPRCIGPGRARTQILFCSIMFFYWYQLLRAEAGSEQSVVDTVTDT